MTDFIKNNDVILEYDEKKFKRMLNKIYALERKNTKTDNLTERRMKEEIQKIIEEEAKKCY